MTMTMIIIALSLLAAPALAAETSPGLGRSGMTGGRGGYLGPSGATAPEQPSSSREHIMTVGGTWWGAGGYPVKLICDKAQDSVANVDNEVMCIDRTNKPYQPVFQRPSGDGHWVFCNPYDISGYNSCSPP